MNKESSNRNSNGRSRDFPEDRSQANSSDFELLCHNHGDELFLQTLTEERDHRIFQGEFHPIRQREKLHSHVQKEPCDCSSDKTQSSFQQLAPWEWPRDKPHLSATTTLEDCPVVHMPALSRQQSHQCKSPARSSRQSSKTDCKAILCNRHDSSKRKYYMNERSLKYCPIIHSPDLPKKGKITFGNSHLATRPSHQNNDVIIEEHPSPTDILLTKESNPNRPEQLNKCKKIVPSTGPNDLVDTVELQEFLSHLDWEKKWVKLTGIVSLMNKDELVSATELQDFLSTLDWDRDD